MDPLFVGSHMIRTVTKEKATWADLPDKFEVGTGKLEGVAGLGAAIDYLQTVGLTNILQHETMLNEAMLNVFDEFNDIVLYGPKTVHDRVSAFSFNLPGYHPHDVGEILNRHHICVRGGHHCAQPLMQALGVSSTVRASFYLYNTKEDIDKLAEGLREVKKVLKK
jgi:cysteine desulfurase/selenocysteine lyase